MATPAEAQHTMGDDDYETRHGLRRSDASDGPDPGGPLRVERRQNPLTQGARYGVTGCAGCSTFVVVALLALIVLASLALHH